MLGTQCILKKTLKNENKFYIKKENKEKRKRKKEGCLRQQVFAETGFLFAI